MKAKDYNKMWRKIFPYMPIIGIPLTYVYHFKYGDTGIEYDKTCWVTALIQGVSIALCISFGIF